MLPSYLSINTIIASQTKECHANGPTVSIVCVDVTTAIAVRNYLRRSWFRKLYLREGMVVNSLNIF